MTSKYRAVAQIAGLCDRSLWREGETKEEEGISAGGRDGAARGSQRVPRWPSSLAQITVETKASGRGFSLGSDYRLRYEGAWLWRDGDLHLSVRGRDGAGRGSHHLGSAMDRGRDEGRGVLWIDWID